MTKIAKRQDYEFRKHFKNKVLLKFFLKYALVFVCLLVFYILSLALNTSYPQKLEQQVKYRVAYSANRLYETENDWTFFFTPNKSSKIDNYADSLMMHIVYCNDTEPIFRSVFGGSIYGDTYASSQLESLNATVNGNPLGEKVFYSRYWHGYRIWLKPLFVFLYYTQIRVVNSYAFYITLLLCCIYLYKKVNIQSSVALLVVMIMLNITLIPMSLLFTTVFVISFISIIFVLEIFQRKPKHLGILFFIIGSVTMFFDFYTYPFLTYGLPMFSIISYEIVKGKKVKDMIKNSVVCLCAWLMGYFLTFFANLLLSSIVLGAQEFTTALNVIKFRFNSGSNPVGIFSLTSKFLYNTYSVVRAALREMMVLPHGLIFLIIAAIWLPLFIFFRKDVVKYFGYIIVFLTPIIWLAVVSGPTKLHIYFQFRGIGLSVLVIIYFFFTSIDFVKFRSFLTRIKKK